MYSALMSSVGGVFCDKVIAMAILDRLLHKIHIVPINGRRYQTSYYEDNLSKTGEEGR